MPQRDEGGFSSAPPDGPPLPSEPAPMMPPDALGTQRHWGVRGEFCWGISWGILMGSSMWILWGIWWGFYISWEFHWEFWWEFMEFDGNFVGNFMAILWGISWGFWWGIHVDFKLWLSGGVSVCSWRFRFGFWTQGVLWEFTQGFEGISCGISCNADIMRCIKVFIIIAHLSHGTCG